MKTLIGIVTFGNLPFTQLTIAEIRRHTTVPFDLFVIVGKPGDMETWNWLTNEGIKCEAHPVNRGFPASLNDIFDYAWSDPAVENVILCGNDVLPYPGAIDAMVAEAARGEWEWICASQFDVKALCATYPAAWKYFSGSNYQFTDYTTRPWDMHTPVAVACAPGIEPHQLKDVQNLCLYRRSVFEKLGYFDANFWPNGYFSDNDYARRAVNAGIKGCGLPHAQYFHFWSRTIHQGETRPNDTYFERNQEFYLLKWGGPFAAEKWVEPFGGHYPHHLGVDREGYEIALPASLKIYGRANENAIIEHWRNK